MDISEYTKGTVIQSIATDHEYTLSSDKIRVTSGLYIGTTILNKEELLVTIYNPYVDEWAKIIK